MKSLRFLSFFLLFFSFSVFVFGQNPSATPPVEDDNDLIKISTNLIQIDVTVTDKNGKVVTDLKPEDFEVYENGKKQAITNFSFISVNPANNPTEPSNSQNTARQSNSIPIPPLKLKPEQVRRTYALVVDDLGIAFDQMSKVKQSLRKFVNEQMQESDLVAVIRTGSGIGAMQSFTSDKRQLLAAIEKIRWNPQGRSGTSTIEPIKQGERKPALSDKNADGSYSRVRGLDEDKIFQDQVKDFRNNSFMVGTLGALKYIIQGMRELPGRKSLILFSDGFALTEKREGKDLPNQIMGTMRVLADLANRSSVVIYTLDPRGLQTVHALLPEDNLWDYKDEEGIDPLEARYRKFIETQDSLRFLAYETGGIPFVNQNNLNLGMEQAVKDQQGYYLLGYTPDDETFDPKKSRFNRLEIKVLRRGLKIRYRSGFFSISDEKIYNTPKTPQQKLLNALTSPFYASEIALNLYPVFQNDANNGDVIQALIHINAKDLKFTQEANGNRKSNFDLIARTFGDNGVQIEELSKNYTVEVSENLYQNMLANGFVYTLSVPIKKSGAYQLRVGLRDTASDKVGSASYFIEVPDIKNRLALSNILLDEFTPTEWQKVRLSGNRDESERSLLLDSALREFRRGTILRYDYVVYNPKPSRSLQTQVRLIRDGHVVNEEQAAKLDLKGQNDPLRIQTGGAIMLGKNLEPGDYVLQIVAFDKNDLKKLATQFVEFQIIE